MPTTIPLNHERAGHIKRGYETIDLDHFDLYDKIINLRFNRRDGSWFTLRSDYEVIFGPNGEPRFRKIAVKPQIEVSYKQVSNSTSVQVFIKVTNMYFPTDTEGATIFTHNNNAVLTIDIQMGYRSMFPDWTQAPLAQDVPGEAAKFNRLKMFNEMSRFTINNSTSDMDTMLQLSVRIISTYNESTPPDRVTVFEGIVGTMEYGQKWARKGSLQKYFSDAAKFPADVKTPLEKACFLYMTCRFLAPGIKAEQSDPGDGMKKRIAIFDYDKVNHAFIPAEKQIDKSIADRYTDITDEVAEEGIFPMLDAVNIGVKCIITNAAKNASVATAVPIPVPDGDSVADPLASVPKIKQMMNEDSQILEIISAFQDLRFYRYMNGNFLIYHRMESVETLVSSEDVIKASRFARPLLLPAVYDVSVTALRTIRCPFVSFISPGQMVGFSAKYTIGDLVGFYYPHNTDMWFLVILSDVEFDTTGDKNMMTLSCVDISPSNTALSVLANEDVGENADVDKEALTDKVEKLQAQISVYREEMEAAKTAAEIATAEAAKMTAEAELAKASTRLGGGAGGKPSLEWVEQSLSQWIRDNGVTTIDLKTLDWSKALRVMLANNFPLLALPEMPPDFNSWKDGDLLRWFLDNGKTDSANNKDIYSKHLKDKLPVIAPYMPGSLEKWPPDEPLLNLRPTIAYKWVLPKVVYK